MKHKELFHTETPVTALLTGRCENAPEKCHSVQSQWQTHLTLCLPFPQCTWHWVQMQPDGSARHTSSLSHCQGPSPGVLTWLWHSDKATSSTSTGGDRIRHSACRQVLWKNRLASVGSSPKRPQSSLLPREPSVQGDKAQGSPCPRTHEPQLG